MMIDAAPQPGAGSNDSTLRIRPYALTGGRTRPAVELAMETLVLTNQRGWSTRHEVSSEQAQMLELAVQPVSVAELSARLGLVMGATRVLVGDLVAAGRMDRSVAAAPTVPEHKDIKLLGRVLDGLRAL